MSDPNSKTENRERSADCYSAGERTLMIRYQAFRQHWLGPLLRLLSRGNITPDHLTLLSLLFGVGFVPLYFLSPTWAMGALVVHMLLDGLDGPLARQSGTASRAGSLTDTLSDQIVVTATTIVLMPHPVHVWAGATYIFLYTIVVTFAMLRNALGTPYGWLIRPRIIIYCWLGAELFLLPQTWLAESVNYALWAFNFLFAWKALTGFWKIRGWLATPSDEQPLS